MPLCAPLVRQRVGGGKWMSSSPHGLLCNKSPPCFLLVSPPLSASSCSKCLLGRAA
ncbi:unnamed protein product, partial [Lampetra planeri]